MKNRNSPRRRDINELAISPKHKKQLERAQNRYSNDLAEKYLIETFDRFRNEETEGFPHLFKREKGAFMHFDLMKMLDDCEKDNGDFDWDAIQQQSTLFCNPLGEGEYDQNKRIPGKSSGGTPPGQRIVNAGWLCLTYEYDGLDGADLEMQLDWFAGKPENCSFAKVHSALSKYPDYRGYCVVFSGHKSLHIHTVWDIRHLSKELSQNTTKPIKTLWSGDVPDEALGPLYRMAWADVAEVITDKLDTNITFDTRLRSLVQKRRSPWGVRTISKSGNIHGFHVGDQVVQTVVQERINNSVPRGAKNAPLFSINKYNKVAPLMRDSQRRPSNRAVRCDARSAVIDKLKTYLADQWGSGFPEPVEIQFDGIHNILFFRNDVHDIHPSTMVQGDFRRLILAGRGAPAGDVFLPNDLSLDETLDLLFPEDSSEFVSHQSRRLRDRMIGPRRFAAKATDKESARNEAGRILRCVSDFSGLTLVQAPEGLGKTYALLNSAMELRWDEDAVRYQNAVARGDTPELTKGFTVVSCSSYLQLHEKRDELLHMPDSPANAIVLPSISKIYHEALEQFPEQTALTTRDAGDHEYRSLIEAIQAIQPHVYARMKVLRDELWKCEDGTARFQSDAFVFMVHDLLKVWPHALYTRAFLHPEFQDEFDPDEAKPYADQMLPYRVIFDEVSWNDLVVVYDEEIVLFAASVREQCKKPSGKGWDDATLSERTHAYGVTLQKTGVSRKDFGFEDCDAIVRLNFKAEDRFAVDTETIPFGKGRSDKNIYAVTHGNAYYSKSLRWFRSLGCPVIILTTEDLPRLIAKAINQTASNADKITIINLTNTPHLQRDTVDLVLEERVRGPRKQTGDFEKSDQSVVELAEELLANGWDHVISDKLGNAKDKFEPGTTMTHVAARGRNDLVGKRIATFATYPSVNEFERLNVLGVAFDIANPIAVSFRDKIYQDLGRNLGFRYVPGQTESMHAVFIKPSLFRDINKLSCEGIEGIGYDRYNFRLLPYST
ncbi:hypothetical protein [Roseibium sp. MMSF_3412]|uniref:hypothetical protein n=1 Tax=Roseibium sp. MMSF_3412 TaxID=3046712 RepID=UPI00273E83C9|nr:hypothetical protein [Roseibium sp. MMSF_3412]